MSDIQASIILVLLFTIASDVSKSDAAKLIFMLGGVVNLIYLIFLMVELIWKII
jgi:hypothetical protein